MPEEDIATYKSYHPSGDTCLGFDYGTRHIGIAVGNLQLGTARPLTVVINRNGTPDWDSICEEVKQWQPSNLVVGWPLTEDGREQPLCDHVKGFVKRLGRNFELPVHLSDERFSSIAAQEKIREMRQSGQRTKRSQHTDIDSISAAIILENWFTQHSE